MWLEPTVSSTVDALASRRVKPEAALLSRVLKRRYATSTTCVGLAPWAEATRLSSGYRYAMKASSRSLIAEPRIR